ncbi:unnamed protein product [Sphacelaria rigidula]
MRRQHRQHTETIVTLPRCRITTDTTYYPSYASYSCSYSSTVDSRSNSSAVAPHATTIFIPSPFIIADNTAVASTTTSSANIIIANKLTTIAAAAATIDYISDNFFHSWGGVGHIIEKGARVGTSMQLSTDSQGS